MPLSKLIDSTTYNGLPAADQAKYQEQDDGTYQLVGDPTPEGDKHATLPLYVSPAELRELPDIVRVFYTNEWKNPDGTVGDTSKYRLRGFDDTNALKNALERTKADRNMLREKLTKYPDTFDPDEFQKLKELEKRQQRLVDQQRSEFDKQFTEAAEQYKNEIKVREEKIAALERDLRGALVEDRYKLEVAGRGGNVNYLLPHLKEKTQIRFVDGRHRAVILGDDDSPRLKPGAQKATDYLEPADYVEELAGKDEWAAAFSATGISGSGAPADKSKSKDAPATISRDDARGFARHAESIARGETKVR